MKGGTSLSKGYRLIDRFSEDIDIHINPPKKLGINENPKNTNRNNIERKKQFYKKLASEIKIDGVREIKRDTAFDDLNGYNSAGIRLLYESVTSPIEGVKEGILLEVGFDNIATNHPIAISSWAYDRASNIKEIGLIDNRATQIPCYDPRYTLIEELQAIATKFRRELQTGQSSSNYIRQYYDVYSLLSETSVQQFIGSKEYHLYKQKRFPKEDLEIPTRNNEAFLLNDPKNRENLERRYNSSKALYYNGQPPFSEVIERIHNFIDRM